MTLWIIGATGGIGQAEDVIPAIEYLPDSDRSDWTTGAVLPVDGGLSRALAR